MMRSNSITKNELPAKAWLFVGLLSVVGCLNYLDRTMITTMRSSIVQDLPMTEAQFGLLTSVFLWVYGLLSPVAGYLADRFSRSKVIIISLFVWSLVTWATGQAKSFEQLLLARAFMGISEACYIPAALALIVDYHRGTTRSLATGIHMGGIMAGQSLGFIGGWIAEKNGWSASFSVLGVTGICYAVLLIFILKDKRQLNPETEIEHTQKEQVSFQEGVFSMFKNASFIKVLCYWSLLGIVSWLVMGWLPTYYKEHFNLSQTIAGIYATGYLYPASLAGVIVGGYLADRWAKKNPFGPILVPIVGLCIGAPFIFLASSTSILPLAILMFMVYAFTRAFGDANMMPILCLVSDPRYRATGYGILSMFSCFVGGGALYAGGYLRDAKVDLSSIYQFAALTMLVCAAILYWAKPKKQLLEN